MLNGKKAKYCSFNPRHQDKLVANWMEISFAEKDLEFMVREQCLLPILNAGTSACCVHRNCF